jgi:glycine cleavage system H protein
MEFPADLKYTKTHEWVKGDGTTVTVGVSEYAQKELSDVVYVELPAVGTDVNAGDSVCVVESVKAAFDIYSPLTGTITEVNDALENDPALVNTACYTDGWFFKMKATQTDEIDALLGVEDYSKHVSSAAH